MDASFMHPEGSARKRLKISRSGAKASPAPSTSAMASASAGNSVDAAREKTHGEGCQHEGALKTLQGDIDAMRNLITCQICHRFMYEPYALSCGHTYCYSCLSQWLGNNRKKTCPDCRAVISQQPTPSYLIREMVLIFANRNQLLSDGETTEEHAALARDEAEIVAKDRSNTDAASGGLFKGCFKRAGPRLLPIHDPGDGVDRCPRCHWEIEDGYCSQCGDVVGDDLSDFSDDDVMTEDELDQELDEYDGDVEIGMDGFGFADVAPQMYRIYDPEVDGYGGMPTAWAHGGHGHRNRITHAPIPISSDVEEDSEEDGDEHDPEMDDFIDDDDERHHDNAHVATMDSDDEDAAVVQQVSHRPRRRGHAHVVISDDEDEGGATQAGAVSVDDSNDEAPIHGDSRRVKRNLTHPTRRPIAVSSSSEEDSSDDDSDSNATQQPNSAGGGFSPLQGGSDDEQSVQSVHYAESEAPSDSSHMHTHFDQDEELDEDDDESDSDDSSDDSDSGWGPHGSSVCSSGLALTGVPGTRAELPPSMRDSRNRLQLGAQHRNRFSNAPAPSTSRRSPARRPTNRRPQPTGSNYLNATSHYPWNRGAPYGAPASHHSRPTAHQPRHPFQLDDTLAGIHSRRSAQISRSISASSEGGVDVGDASSSSSSSGASSQTIGPSDQQAQRPLNRLKRSAAGVSRHIDIR